MLSMSFVTRLRTSPRGMAVEVLQRQPAELLVDVRAQPADGPLGDAGHDPGLHPAEERAQDVDADEQDAGSPASALKSMPWPGVRSIAATHVGELVLAAGRAGRRRPGPCVTPGRQAGWLMHAVEDVVGRVAEDLRADDREGDADDREDDDERDQRRAPGASRRSAVGTRPGSPSASGRAGIPCPSSRAPPPGRPARADRTGRRRRPGGAARRARAVPPGPAAAGRRSAAHATASASDSCE